MTSERIPRHNVKPFIRQRENCPDNLIAEGLESPAQHGTMHPDLAGFYKAPVTYAYLCGTGMASTAALFMDMQHQMGLDMVKVTRHSQYWRLLTSHFAFDNGIAVALGMYVIFQFRVIERQFGSNKFGTLVILVLLASTALQISLKFPALAGPYTIHDLHGDAGNVPQLQPRLYSAMGVNISDKSSLYVLLCVICLRSYSTAFPFATGVLVGTLYQSKFLPLSKLRTPSFLAWFFELFHPIFMVVPASVLQQQRQRQLMEMQRRTAAAAGHPAAAGPAGQGFREQLIPGMGMGGMGMAHQRTPPLEAAIEQLTALGFERDQAIAALQASDNNVEAAANRLLNAT
ncbi:Aste57867_22872 [Aphanomyces stellatus]|uniref:Aste57867_22872 protein n=1 Tax=Aphanomyces stellatus TaxID=120398 RepID=A0A485LLA8_9STRA|nr:hypothetical protein As57867_022801 [Aphanomyces stellatus]VFT99522.1 Aste57867_22872 [Aphanomyces stellatus]